MENLGASLGDFIDSAIKRCLYEMESKPNDAPLPVQDSSKMHLSESGFIRKNVNDMQTPSSELPLVNINISKVEKFELLHETRPASEKGQMHTATTDVSEMKNIVSPHHRPVSEKRWVPSANTGVSEMKNIVSPHNRPVWVPLASTGVSEMKNIVSSHNSAVSQTGQLLKTNIDNASKIENVMSSHNSAVSDTRQLHRASISDVSKKETVMSSHNSVVSETGHLHKVSVNNVSKMETVVSLHNSGISETELLLDTSCKRKKRKPVRRDMKESQRKKKVE